MKFITENWFVIVAIAAMGGSIGYAIYTFCKMPPEKQLNKVREWLLYAVTTRKRNWEQEQEKSSCGMYMTCSWRGLTGLQRSSRSTCFSMMVDDALEQMKTMLEENEAAQKFVAGDVND